MIDAMISVKPKYVKKMLIGEKNAELRTRKINLPLGSRIWVYSTLPVGAVEVFAILSKVVTGTPVEIWKKFSGNIAISKNEFDNYCKGYEQVSVVLFSTVETLKKKNSLDALRKIKKGFQPPQFFMKLTNNDPVKKFLTSQI